MAVANIKTIILLMFENRSFDNMLGHLSFDGLQSQADGLTTSANRDAYTNYYKGGLYHPYQYEVDQQLSYDLPHEYNFVATELEPGSDGRPAMTGFVKAYAAATGTEPNLLCDSMGFFKAQQVPITSFLARTFATCDKWFCPLPSSTQPNRTVAFCGQSAIYETKFQDIPDTGNIFQWLEDHQISWGVYHDGFSFFALYFGLIPRILFSGRFHPYEQLAVDLKNGKQPQVIIVEPSYQDAPHIGPDHPNDNHPPLAVGWGEDFLRRTYQAVSTSPIWASSLMTVFYDEHGGFYDHVSPPPFNQVAAGNVLPPPPAPGSAPIPYNTLGPRVPAILVSPWVDKGAVLHNRYDHTSVLQLLAEMFTPGVPYSAAVKNRADQGIASLSSALRDVASNVPAPPPPADPIAFTYGVIGENIATPPDSEMGKAFEAAAIKMLNEQPPAAVDATFPSLRLWKTAIDQARGQF